MIPSPAERDELFKRFARALFKGDMDALYQAVTPDFLWSFHDGLAVTKSLQGPDAIAAHLAEQKALLSAQRFHDVAYHHAGDISFMTFRVSETVRATGEQREQRGIERYTFCGRQARDQGRLSQAALILRAIKARPVMPDNHSHASTAPAFSPISTRSAPSAPTRPACTSRPSPSRTSARCTGWRSGCRTPG